MTDKEKILAEIERMQSRLDLDNLCGISVCINLECLKNFIESLPEETYKQ